MAFKEELKQVWEIRMCSKIAGWIQLVFSVSHGMTKVDMETWWWKYGNVKRVKVG